MTSPDLISTHKRISPATIVVMAAVTMLIWSAIFWRTYLYSFYWDDHHQVRSYSFAELIAGFYGPYDPDWIETVSLRPVALLLLGIQGGLFGENVVLQRVFIAVVMGALLCAVGLLLDQVGLSLLHIAIVFALFACSKVFISLMLWMTICYVILTYVFMTLAAVCYLRWLDGDWRGYLPLMLGCSAVAIFAREEGYTLPVVLPLVWYLFSRQWTKWRSAAAGALGVALIAASHWVMRGIFLPEAIPLRPSLGVLTAIEAAWMPIGLNLQGYPDELIGLLWRGYLGCLLIIFARIASRPAFRCSLGACGLGLILSTPSLGVPRAFGIAMPTIAFSTAIAIAVLEIHRRAIAASVHRLWAPAVLTMLVLGLGLGIAGGIQRSMYVAEALQENSAEKVLRDGLFLFDTYPHPANVPAERRKAGLERLARFDIHTRDDLMRLKQEFELNRRRRVLNAQARVPLIRSKYEFLAF